MMGDSQHWASRCSLESMMHTLFALPSGDAAMLKAGSTVKTGLCGRKW